MLKLVLNSGAVLLCAVLLTSCSSSDDGQGVVGADTNASVDTGSTDSGSGDSGSGDSGSSDSGSSDSGSGDSGSSDSGSTDLGSADSGSADSGSTDTGSADSGASDSGSTDSGASLLTSCETVTSLQLQNSGGVFNTMLPADLSAPGSQISIQTQPSGQLTAFDSQSGAITFIPGNSRLPTNIGYQVVDVNNTVLANHQHQLVLQPVRVMPLGDSITAGVEFFDGASDLPPMPERVGYRKFLYDRLLEQGYPVDFMGQGGQSAGAQAGLADPENNGYPGVDIDFLNSKLVEQLTEDQVDVILLHIGTNNTPANAAGIDTWLDELDTWEASNNPVIALVATIVPKRDQAQNDQVDLFNADLRQRIQARTNDSVFLIEQNTAVTVADISSEPIGIHPSAAGYQKMANAWFDGLTANPVLNKCE